MFASRPGGCRPPFAADVSLHLKPEEWTSAPVLWRRRVEGELAPGEEPLAWFGPDLDEQLRFWHSFVVLTDRRLLSAAADSDHTLWRSWPLEEIAEVRLREHGGLGAVEARGRKSLLAVWRHTAAVSTAAAQFVRRANETRTPGGANSFADAASVCPSCGARLPPGQSLCSDCAPVPAPPPTRSLWRLTRFARPRAGVIAVGFGLTLAGAGAGLVPPYLTMPLLDKVLIPHQNGQPVNFNLAWWCLGGLLGAALLAWILSWAKTYVLAWVSEQVAADLRNQTYSHLQRLSLEFFGGKRTGDLIARVGSDTDRICNFLSVNLVDFSTDAVMIVMTAAILLTIDPAMAMVTLLPLPLVAWLIQRVRVRLRHGFARGSAAWAGMINVLADTIPGIRVVKAFAQEQREIDRFHRANQHVLDANNRVNRLWASFGPAVTLLTDCGLLVIWGYGVWRVAHHEITVGVLTAFVAYISRLYVRLDSMSRMLASTQRAAAATHRIFEILDRKATVAEPVRPVYPGRLEGRIELNGVWFKYGARAVIRNLKLTIEPGEMIGLVGPSGAGKSTLINLVCRFYDVAEGAIRVDGHDIRSFPVEEYRRNIGIVLQEPFLFFGSIAENIAYGRPDATRGEIIAAARAARAHEFILKLTDGYDSLVGERGQSLSGGERQRISIARALLTDPRILILDEATSSVDTETERDIQEALENLIRGRTTIAIAHRMSTLRRADRLVVMENGEITEVGRHDELLERSGTYARLHRAQIELTQDIASAAGGS
jgi:ATP-binding cassette, subfamily B, bacterial